MLVFPSCVCFVKRFPWENNPHFFASKNETKCVCVVTAGNTIVFINSHLMCSARCPAPHIFLFTIENYRQTSENVTNFFVFFLFAWHNNFLCLHKIVLFWLGNNGFQSSFYFHNYAKATVATAAKDHHVRYAKGKHAISINRRKSLHVESCEWLCSQAAHSDSECMFLPDSFTL